MHRFHNTERMGKLVAIQRMRRSEAEAALSAARALAETAEGREAAARELATAAHADWAAVIERPGFAPDHVRWLGGVVARQDGAAAQASDRRARADSVCQHREDDWRRADAVVRSTEAVLAKARRADASRREERRLAVLADRATAVWKAR